MKNVTVSLDDGTYRNAKRRAGENDRSLSSVVREYLQSYGAQESEFDRLAGRERALKAQWAAHKPDFRGDDREAREQLYDCRFQR